MPGPIREEKPSRDMFAQAAGLCGDDGGDTTERSEEGATSTEFMNQIRPDPKQTRNQPDPKKVVALTRPTRIKSLSDMNITRNPHEEVQPNQIFVQPTPWALYSFRLMLNSVHPSTSFLLHDCSPNLALGN